jgi:hypothetical protein
LSGTFADSNRADLRAIPEVTWGVTPASGTSKQVRYTSSSLAPTKDTRASDEIRADRMVSNNVETAFNSGGDINFELSAGGQDEWLEGFLAGTWSRPMEMFKFQGVVSWGTTSRLDIVSATDLSTMFVASRRIKVDGFKNPLNNGYFQISSVAYAGGAIQVTVCTSTSVIEVASPTTRVYDANDVVILKNTNIRMGTAGAATIDSNSTNAFASAIAAGQLKVGQRIFVDGNGLEAGTVVWALVAGTGDTFTISDGVKSKTFVAGTDFAVGASASDSATNSAAAINLARVNGQLNVKATASTGTVTITNLNVTGGSITEDVDAGTNFTVTNFTGGDASARGVFTLTSLADDVLGVSPTPPTVGAGTAVTIKASMLRNPGDVAAIVNRSWTIETHFTDVTRQFATDGQRVGGLSLTFTAGEIVTGSVSFQGRDYAKISTRRLALSPYVAFPTGNTEIVNATSNVGSIFKNNVVLTSAVREITLTGESNLRPQTAVSSKYPRGIGIGRLNITGSVNAYFNTIELFDHFKAHDTVSLAFTVIDIDSNTYYYALPAVKFSSDNIVPEGIDQDVMETIEFMAQRDVATECMMQVDRFSSTAAV